MTHTLTVAEAEAACREFAAQFDLPNVRRGIALAESGRISWFDLYEIAREALVKAAEVTGPAR